MTVTPGVICRGDSGANQIPGPEPDSDSASVTATELDRVYRYLHCRPAGGPRKVIIMMIIIESGVCPLRPGSQRVTVSSGSLAEAPSPAAEARGGPRPGPGGRCPGIMMAANVTGTVTGSHGHGSTVSLSDSTLAGAGILSPRHHRPVGRLRRLPWSLSLSHGRRGRPQGGGRRKAGAPGDRGPPSHESAGAFARLPNPV